MELSTWQISDSRGLQEPRYISEVKPAEHHKGNNPWTASQHKHLHINSSSYESAANQDVQPVLKQPYEVDYCRELVAIKANCLMDETASLKDGDFLCCYLLHFSCGR